MDITMNNVDLVSVSLRSQPLSNIAGWRRVGLQLGHGYFSGFGVLVAHLHLRETISRMKDGEAERGNETHSANMH